MKKMLKNKVVIWILAIVTVIAVCTITIAVWENQQHMKIEDTLQNVQVVESKTIELDNQEHIFKAEDFIQENNDNEKYGKLELQYGEDNTTEYKITADTVKTENVNLVAHFEKYPNITKDYNVTVSIVDTTVPEFTEKVDTITINKGEELDVASKFKATDLSGDVEIKVDGTIDVNTVGEQTVNVFATDKNGNVAQTEVKVVVNEKPKQEEKATETTSTVASTNKSSSNKNSTPSKSIQSSSKNSKSATNNSGSKNTSKGNSSTSNSKNNTASSTKPYSSNNNEPSTPNCTNDNHSMPTGNSGKWFNSKNECKEYMSQIWNMWGEKLDNNEITREEYGKKSPYGYECWSCSNCGKWTLNFKYR